MARKKDNTGLLIGAALIGFALFTMNKPQRFTPNPKFPTLPPEPPRNNAAQWAQWANGIIQVSGGLVNDLFGPGGPFHKLTESEVMAATGQVAPGQCINPFTGQFYPC